MDKPVLYLRKVRYSDTDAQGHVFNVHYFTYFDDAITDYMERALGAPGPSDECDIVLARAECDFRSSAKLGETLETRVRVAKLGRTSLTFALVVTEQSSGRLVVEGKEIYVAVDPKTMQPIPVPDSLRAAIAQMERAAG